MQNKYDFFDTLKYFKWDNEYTGTSTNYNKWKYNENELLYMDNTPWLAQCYYIMIGYSDFK